MLLITLFVLVTPVSGAWEGMQHTLLSNDTSPAASRPLHIFVLLDKSKARRRWKSMMAQAELHNFLVHPLPYLDQDDFKSKQHLTQQSLNESLLAAQQMDVPDDEVLVFAQDDTVFHDNLRCELKQSLASLPQDWEVFHMCPRDLNLGSNQFLHTEPVPFKLTQTEEYEATQPEANRKHPRYYDVRLMKFILKERKHAFLGGPVSFATKKKFIPHMLKKLEGYMGRRLNDDQLLIRIADKSHFVSREPQLCMTGFDTSFE
uniref:Hexosyltransferase n=1 Tax=Lotharella globosa TaxID=91324 RepID=A0A7S3YX37_9EUKA|mmetsp:Transcript_11505/g.23177  ORF Transcript_11505/g.23177 Transcript_11505/m.23177 type:complete len:260 (+) Transcript_11505:149-928(+)